MQREDQRDLKLIQQGILSILTLIYQNAPTMIYNDTINLIRLVYEYGRLNGRDEKEKELMLFKGRDPDEKRRHRKC